MKTLKDAADCISHGFVAVRVFILFSANEILISSFKKTTTTIHRMGVGWRGYHMTQRATTWTLKWNNSSWNHVWNEGVCPFLDVHECLCVCVCVCKQETVIQLLSAPLQAFGWVVVVNKSLYFCAGGRKKVTDLWPANPWQPISSKCWGQHVDQSDGLFVCLCLMIITEIKQVRSVWAALTSERVEESQSSQILRQCLLCVFPCFLQGFVDLHSDGPQTQTGPGAANHKSLNSPCLQMSWEETHTSERWACNGPDHDVYPAADNDGEWQDFHKLINLTRKTKTGTHTDSLLVLQGAINQRFWMTAHTHRQHRFELLWLCCVLWFRSSVRPPACTSSDCWWRSSAHLQHTQVEDCALRAALSVLFLVLFLMWTMSIQIYAVLNELHMLVNSSSSHMLSGLKLVCVLLPVSNGWQEEAIRCLWCCLEGLRTAEHLLFSDFTWFQRGACHRHSDWQTNIWLLMFRSCLAAIFLWEEIPKLSRLAESNRCQTESSFFKKGTQDSAMMSQHSINRKLVSSQSLWKMRRLQMCRLLWPPAVRVWSCSKTGPGTLANTGSGPLD